MTIVHQEENIHIMYDDTREEQCFNNKNVIPHSNCNETTDNYMNSIACDVNVNIKEDTSLYSNEVSQASSEDDDDEEEAEESVEKKEEESLAPDGGWGWVIVCGAAFVLMCVDTLAQCFGIVFSSFLLEHNASSLTTAWMINMFNFFFCLTSLPLGPLIKEFGWRKIAFIASFSLSVATVSSAFATSVWVLYLTYSLLAGVSCGMLLTIGYTIVPHYFSRRRGFASGIIMALDSGGQILAPPLVKILQEEYTYKGATLILGGVVLNCFVAAAVFHPVEWHSKPSISYTEKIANVSTTSKKVNEEVSTKNRPMIIHLVSSMIANLRILGNLRAVFIAIATNFSICGLLNFMAFMPFFMLEKGFTLGDAAQCVSASAIFNTVTRLLIASLTDYSWFNYRMSLMFSCSTLTITMIAFSQLQDLRWMTALMCIYGVGVGSYMCLFNLVMVHYMGLKNLMPMMGATMMCISIGNIILGPLAGYVRDISGSYAIFIWILAGLKFSSFLLWLFMPIAVKYDEKRQNQTES